MAAIGTVPGRATLGGLALRVRIGQSKIGVGTVFAGQAVGMKEAAKVRFGPRTSELSGSAAQHGQFKLTPDVPTAALRQIEASVALGGNCPDGAHVHSGEHVCNPTAALRMKRQSDAIGTGPELRG